MKKKLLTIFASVCVSMFVKAQLIPNKILNWGFPSSEYVNKSFSINDSITHIGGMYFDSTYVDPLNPSTKIKGSSQGNIFLSKYDRKNDNLLWSINYPNAVDHQFLDYGVDFNGNTFALIQFSQTFDVDPGVGTTTVTSVYPGSKSVVLVKYNSTGNYVFHKLITQAPSTPTWISPVAVKIKSSGDVLITGYSSSSINFDYGVSNFSAPHNGNDDNLFVAQYSNSLTLEWVYSPNQSSSQSPVSLHVDNNLDATIHFKSGNGFVLPSSTIVTTTTNADCIIKLNDFGVPIWSGYVPSTGNYSSNNQIAVNEDGSFIFTGALTGANVDVDLGSTSTALSMHYYADAFIAFYSANGNMKWANVFYGQTYTYAYSPSMHNGKIYLTFTGFGTIDMDPSTSTANFSGPSYFNDYLAAYDSTGKYLWANLYPTKFNGNGVNMTFYSNQISLHPKNWGGAQGDIIDADFSSNVVNFTHYGSQDNSMFIYDFCTVSTYSNTTSICFGDSVQIVGKWRKSAGIYKDTLKTLVYKCDSVIVTNLSVNSLPSLTAISNNTLICVGETATLTATGANTYTWSTTNNGNSIAVSPTVTTSYSVTGTDVNGCSNSSVVSQSVSLCTGIAQLVHESSVSVSPNPFTDVITIKNSFENYNITIVDVLGKVVVQIMSPSQETEIDLSYLNQGFYQLIVKGDNKSYTQKIIKQ